MKMGIFMMVSGVAFIILGIALYLQSWRIEYCKIEQAKPPISPIYIDEPFIITEEVIEGNWDASKLPSFFSNEPLIVSKHELGDWSGSAEIKTSYGTYNFKFHPKP